MSTRECADCLGVSTDFILKAIKGGHLQAERIDLPGRRPFYRVHEEDFVRFLLLMKWTRIPDRFSEIATSLQSR